MNADAVHERFKKQGLAIRNVQTFFMWLGPFFFLVLGFFYYRFFWGSTPCPVIVKPLILLASGIVPMYAAANYFQASEEYENEPLPEDESSESLYCFMAIALSSFAYGFLCIMALSIGVALAHSFSTAF